MTSFRLSAVVTSATLATLVTLPAFAQGSNDLQRCRALKDNAARLACYDAIPLAAPSASAPVAPAAPAVAASASAPVAAAASAAQPLPPAAAANAYAPQTQDQFGLERQQSQVLVKSIESRLIGEFDGWEPNQRFTLENGQVWQVSDDSRGVGMKTNPKVRITRGTFGTFFLEVEGVNAAPRVKRVR